MSGNPENQSISQVATGIAGLDDILGGGLAANRLYLVEGDPGSGKTTLALQYLLSGVAKGEKTLAWFKRRSQLRGGSGPAPTKSLLRLGLPA